METLPPITDKRVDEASGVAPSRITPGIYFTHNDSGDSARFFKFNLKGQILATYDVTNAGAKDWEDMATAKVDGKPYVFCGDIGDNKGKRDHIEIYRVPEPTGKSGPVEADQVYKITYPDEPHNAETLLVNPKTGDITIVTKAADKPSIVFFLPRPKKSGDYTPKKIGELSLGFAIRETRLITGGAISPDAKHVVLRTYLQGYEFDVPSKFNDWVKATPRTVHLNFDPQGEGITYSADGKAFITTSEKSPCQVSRVTISD